MIRKPKLTELEKTKEGETLKFVPLGGLEEIGRNMMFFEYRNEIVVIDAGLQFPEETTPGIDYIIPNVSYLESKKQNVCALILTHGHYDHIGAVPYVLQKIGNPPIYSAAISKEIVLKRQSDFPNAAKPKIEVIKDGDEIKLGQYFTAGFFNVEHTIPDTIGVILKTPVGNMVHFPDFKFDYDHDGKPRGLDRFAEVGKIGVHTLFIDSTNAEEEGYSISERLVEKNLEELIKNAEGRVVIGTFGSLITRLGEIIKIGARLHRKVFVSGYSMKTNLQIAQNLGYLKFEKGTILPLEEIHKYKDEKVLVLCTGAQGESNASLMRMVTGEHQHLKVRPGDTIIFSSSIIPGNERGIQVLKDDFTRQGARVYQSKFVDIHSSGHAPKEELKTVMRIIKPKFIVPVHGYYFMRAANRENAAAVGVPSENVLLMDNGQIAEATKTSFTVTNRTVDAYYVMVDGLGVGDVEKVVLRDRMVLAQEGMLVIIITLDKESGRLLKNPDIISRGFIYLKENQEILGEVRHRIRAILGRIPQKQEIETDYLKTLVRDQIGQFIYNQTHRRPMILPVIIEV